MRKDGHVCAPGLQGGVEHPEDDSELFEDKMKRQIADRCEQRAECARPDAAIADNLQALGFGGGG